MTKFPLQSPLKILGPSTWIARTEAPIRCFVTRTRSNWLSFDRGSFEQWISPFILPNTTPSRVTDKEVILSWNLVWTCPVMIGFEGWSSSYWSWCTEPFCSPQNALWPRTFEQRMPDSVAIHRATQCTSRIFQMQNNFRMLVTPIKWLNSTSLFHSMLLYFSIVWRSFDKGVNDDM